MTSVAASVFASPAPSSLSGASDVAQPDLDAFGALLGVAAPVVSAPALLSTADVKLPQAQTPMSSLLALASIDQTPPVPTDIATKAAPVIVGKQAQPDILVVQPAPATDPETPPVEQPPVEQPPVVRAAPDLPTECPAAPETPPATPVRDKVLPPVSPARRRPETPPIISVLQPVVKAPDTLDEIKTEPTEQTKPDRPKAEDTPADARPPQAAPPQPAPPLPAPPLPAPPPAPAVTIAPAVALAVAPPATTADHAPAETKPATASAPISADLKTGEPARPGDRIVPIEARDADRQPDQGEDRDQPPPAPSASAPKADDAVATRDPAPAFAPAVAPANLAAPSPARPPIATITAEPGRIGQELGVAIAHHVGSGNAATGGGETITLRLNPVDMGRIDVQLSFDDSGTLRAVVSADNPAALDMLRRDSADLGRALADAGVRADTQTLRFDTRSDGQRGGQPSDNGQPWQRQPHPRAAHMSDADFAPQEDIAAAYRPLRTRGRVDMVA